MSREKRTLVVFAYMKIVEERLGAVRKHCL